MQVANTVVFSAPAGWGKTRAAEMLREIYRCAHVVDDWNTGKPITAGALHLTNQQLLDKTKQALEKDGVEVIDSESGVAPIKKITLKLDSNTSDRLEALCKQGWQIEGIGINQIKDGEIARRGIVSATGLIFWTPSLPGYSLQNLLRNGKRA